MADEPKTNKKDPKLCLILLVVGECIRFRFLSRASNNRTAVCGSSGDIVSEGARCVEMRSSEGSAPSLIV